MASLWQAIVGRLGPGVFWFLWCTTFGWALAVWCTAIPPESAGVKLVAAILGPAAGAALAAAATLRVMRETGKRDARRAVNHLRAAVESVERLFWDLIESRDLEAKKSDREVIEDLIRGRPALKPMLELEGALHVSDTLTGAHLYRDVSASFTALRELLDLLGPAERRDPATAGELAKAINRFRLLLGILGRQKNRLTELATEMG
jgi:hypothetical protein